MAAGQTSRAATAVWSVSEVCEVLEARSTATLTKLAKHHGLSPPLGIALVDKKMALLEQAREEGKMKKVPEGAQAAAAAEAAGDRMAATEAAIAALQHQLEQAQAGWRADLAAAAERRREEADAAQQLRAAIADLQAGVAAADGRLREGTDEAQRLRATVADVQASLAAAGEREREGADAAQQRDFRTDVVIFRALGLDEFEAERGNPDGLRKRAGEFVEALGGDAGWVKAANLLRKPADAGGGDAPLVIRCVDVKAKVALLRAAHATRTGGAHHDTGLRYGQRLTYLQQHERKSRINQYRGMRARGEPARLWGGYRLQHKIGHTWHDTPPGPPEPAPPPPTGPATA